LNRRRKKVTKPGEFMKSKNMRALLSLTIIMSAIVVLKVSGQTNRPAPPTMLGIQFASTQPLLTEATPIIPAEPLPAGPIVPAKPVPAEPVVPAKPVPAEPVVPAQPAPVEPVVPAKPVPTQPVVPAQPAPPPSMPIGPEPQPTPAPAPPR
jgi:hypothetical protein